MQLGPPVHFNRRLINTDFVLQEPPKHAFYDNNTASSDYGQIVTVSRYDSTNVALTTSTGTTFSGKSTDTSNWSIGASTAVNAGSSIGGGIGDMVEAEASVDVTAKVGYDYNQNKDNYNSNYGERTITQTEQTDHDDKLLGRLQTIDIWRYRVYGVAVNDQQGQPSNAFYEVILPGPTLPFNGGGLDFDWYQPTYENGNVLSYPQLSNSAFSPADLGSYKIPCPSAPPGPDCNPDGTKTISGAMIPASQVFFNGTSGKLSLDFKNSTGSGQSFSYSHSLAESLDAKVAVSAKVDAGVANVEGHASVDVELHNNNSWGNTTTSDVTTTSDTGITLSRSSGDSAQAYAFYPVFYTTQDGTIKVTHAADVFSSSTGKSFWASIYAGSPTRANLRRASRHLRPGRHQPDRLDGYTTTPRARSCAASSSASRRLTPSPTPTTCSPRRRSTARR